MQRTCTREKKAKSTSFTNTYSKPKGAAAVGPKPSKWDRLKITYLAGADVGAIRVDLWVVVKERGH